MQVLQAGQHKLIYLELQPQMVTKIARDAGFETRAKDGQRSIQLDLSAPGPQRSAPETDRCSWRLLASPERFKTDKLSFCNRNGAAGCGIDSMERGPGIASGGSIFGFPLIICRLFGAGFFCLTAQHHFYGV